MSPEDIKQVVDAGPFDLKSLVPTLWMGFVAVSGGLVSFYHKLQSGKVRAFNFTEFIGEIATSAVSGLVTYWLCKAFGVNEYATAAGVAISGHMGARILFILENKAERLINRFEEKNDAS